MELHALFDCASIESCHRLWIPIGLASIIIGPPSECMTLTTQSITTTGGPLTIGSDIVLSQDQTWQGVVYAGDGQNILINPRSKTSVFTTQVIGTDTSSLRIEAEPTQISIMTNTQGDRIYESIAANDIVTVNVSGNKTYQATSIADRFTVNTQISTYTFSATTSDTSSWTSPIVNRTYTCNTLNWVFNIAGVRYRLQPTMVSTPSGPPVSALIFVQM